MAKRTTTKPAPELHEAATIAMALPKGGAAKTTSTVHLARGLARQGKRCLVVDLDAQGHSSIWLRGGERAPDGSTTLQVLLQEASLEDVVVPTRFENIEICCSDRSLSRAVLALAEEYGRESRLKAALEACRERWDIVLLDCPPAMDLLSANALKAATHLLSPVVPAYFSLEGVREFELQLKKVRQNLNPDLKRLGFLLCAVDNREAIAEETRTLLKGFAPELLLPTEVRVDTRLKLGYSPDRTRGVQDYEKVAKEILSRLRVHSAEQAIAV